MNDANLNYNANLQIKQVLEERLVVGGRDAFTTYKFGRSFNKGRYEIPEPQ